MLNNVSKITCNVIFKSNSENVHRLYQKRAKGDDVESFWSELTPPPTWRGCSRRFKSSEPHIFHWCRSALLSFKWHPMPQPLSSNIERVTTLHWFMLWFLYWFIVAIPEAPLRILKQSARPVWLAQHKKSTCNEKPLNFWIIIHSSLCSQATIMFWTGTSSGSPTAPTPMFWLFMQRRIQERIREASQRSLWKR